MPKLRGILLVALVVTLPACSSYRSYRQAQMAATTGDWDQAVLFYMNALEKDPSNITYQAALLRAKIQASQEHFAKARKFYESGVLERALVEYQQAVQLDPSNQSAAVELDRVRREIAAARQDQELDTSIEAMKRRVESQSGPPTLNPRSDEPIDLDFPEPVRVKDIYRSLARAFGINIIFDTNLKDPEVPVVLKQVTSQDALEFLMRTANHFYKVLDEHTILVIDDSPQNRRKHEDLVIQTFFLSNAEVKDVVTMLRSLIDAKKIATNEQLNAIVLRDTADKVKIAERIIRANDKARAEVVIDVELLQINSTKLQELGVNWPSQISATIDTGGEGVPLRLSDVEFLDQSDWTLTIPSFIYNFVKTNSDAQLLARPQLRISEGERANLHIGNRVPVPVTSFNTGNTVGGNVVPITSFQYQDVGIQISLEPRVHHNKEVTMQLRVEVSNLSGSVDSGGQSQPIIGTRTIESTIRLKDGETNFLAGLLRTDENASESGLPGLSEIPVLGRLFSNNRNQTQRTDVILTLTPHIIRSADIKEEDLLPIWSGTEQQLTFRGRNSPRVESQVEGPFDGEGTDAEQIREMIQRRIQQLPRGLRNQAEGEQETTEPPGVDLVPPPRRPSLFEEEEDEDEPPLASLDAGEGALDVAWGTIALASSAAQRPARGGNAAAAGPESVGAKAPPVRLTLSPRRSWVAAGDLLEVTVHVDSRRELSHLPITLRYDPALLAAEGVESAGFLGSEAEAPVLADLTQPGRITIGASRLGAVGGVSGEGAAIRLRLRALRPGSSEITFEKAQALDPELGEIPGVVARPAAIEIGPPESRPEVEAERPAREST